MRSKRHSLIAAALSTILFALCAVVMPTAPGTAKAATIDCQDRWNCDFATAYEACMEGPIQSEIHCFSYAKNQANAMAAADGMCPQVN